jgi:hypothetical protein
MLKTLLSVFAGGWGGPALIAAAIAGGGAWHFYSVHEARKEGDAAGSARVTALWDAERHRARALAEQATADNLMEERRRQAAMQKEIDHATTALDAARRDADAAGRAAVGLRAAARAAAAGCRAAAPNPHAAASGPAATGPGDLLADVLGLVEQAGRDMAAESDRRGIAGSACERAYQSLTTNAQGGHSP